MNSGNVLQTWKALWVSVCYIPISTRTSYASSQWKLILHHPEVFLHPSAPNHGASCTSHIASHGFLSCPFSWHGHNTLPLILLIQSKCPFFHPWDVGCLHSSNTSAFLLFHTRHTMFSMPESSCCNHVNMALVTDFPNDHSSLCFSSSHYIIRASPEIQYHISTLPPQRSHSRSLTVILHPFLWSCLFISEINPLGCWIASRLISIWKMDGAEVRELLCWTVWLGAIKYLFHLQTSVIETVTVLNKWQHSACSLLLPLGFLTLLQIGMFWSLMLV